jgi:hypothetical protein
MEKLTQFYALSSSRVSRMQRAGKFIQMILMGRFWSFNYKQGYTKTMIFLYYI